MIEEPGFLFIATDDIDVHRLESAILTAFRFIHHRKKP
jgi:hypothetical protein